MNVHEHPVVVLARNLAKEAHAGGVDKMGRDYFEFHLRPIAESLAPFGWAAVAAGWLHDIIEDTHHTALSLLAAGVPRFVVDAVVSVTRMPGETYPALITRSLANPLGRIVKLADNTLNLLGNAALALTDPVKAESLKHGRYLPARARLRDGLDEDPRDVAAMVAHLEGHVGAIAA